MKHAYHEAFMRQAIALGREGALIKKTGGPFGAVIAQGDQIVGQGYNQVIYRNDPTWHGEIHAIRDACAKIGSPHLKGYVLYTSAEPCPMCLAAAYWAHIDHIFYAARVEDALAYGEFQDRDIFKEMKIDSAQRIIQSTELLRDEALEVWKEFSVMPGRARY